MTRLDLVDLDRIEGLPLPRGGLTAAERDELVRVYRIALSWRPDGATLAKCAACGEPRDAHDRSSKCHGFEPVIPF
jgi:hypothetical protein